MHLIRWWQKRLRDKADAHVDKRLAELRARDRDRVNKQVDEYLQELEERDA
jgi:hypothetical protein